MKGRIGSQSAHHKTQGGRISPRLSLSSKIVHSKARLDPEATVRDGEYIRNHRNLSGFEAAMQPCPFFIFDPMNVSLRNCWIDSILVSLVVPFLCDVRGRIFFSMEANHVRDGNDVKSKTIEQD
jgi:hypothetical protein